MEEETKELESIGETLKRIEELKAFHKPKMEGRVSEEPELIIVRGECGREVAIPNKKNVKKRRENWEIMVAKAGMDSKVYNLKDREGKPIKLDDWTRGYLAELGAGEQNTILHGGPGRGKTTLLLMALYNLWMEWNTVGVYRFPDVKKMMEPGFLEKSKLTKIELLQKFTTPKYLLLDEVGYSASTGGRITPHEASVMFEIISKRDVERKWTWISTNLNMARLSVEYGDAMMSRLNRIGYCIEIDFCNRVDYRRVR